MVNKALIKAELDAYNCEVVESNVHQAMLLQIDGKNIIGVNPAWNEEKRLYAVLHELAHIRTNTLYDANATEQQIKECEQRANEDLIETNYLATEYLYFKSKNYDDSDILKILDMPADFLPKVIDYANKIKLKYLTDYLDMI